LDSDRKIRESDDYENFEKLDDVTAKENLKDKIGKSATSPQVKSMSDIEIKDISPASADKRTRSDVSISSKKIQQDTLKIQTEELDDNQKHTQTLEQ